MTGGLHPVLDSASSDLRVIARLDTGGRHLALVEVSSWELVEVPADNVAAAVAGSLWYGTPTAPGTPADRIAAHCPVPPPTATGAAP